MTDSWHGRRACVTGGTSGIGRSVVEKLLGAGASVIAIGRTEAHAAELVDACSDLSERLAVISGDLREQKTLDRLETELSTQGHDLALLVNAAGTISGGGLLAEDLETWERVLSTNLTATFLATKACVPYLEKCKSGASIVNISSVCSLRPCASLSYSVTKAGTDMLTKVIAKELASKGVRVNAVNPGVVRTNLQKSAGLLTTAEAYEDWVEKMSPMHPLGRIGLPEDVANAVLFLASDEASWVTGSILSVDGGRAVQ